jgi:hypothetical protein
MFKRLSQIAEQGARVLSRRQFLGSLGRAAMLAAAAAGGLLAWPAAAEGGAAAANPRVCALDSPVEACRGLPLGSPCIAGNNRPGRCVSDGNNRDASGAYYCNYCKSSGSPRGSGR